MPTYVVEMGTSLISLNINSVPMLPTTLAFTNGMGSIAVTHINPLFTRVPYYKFLDYY